METASPPSGIPGLPQTDIVEAKKKEERRRRKENKKLKKQKLREEVNSEEINSEEIFSSKFKSIFAAQEHRRHSFSHPTRFSAIPGLVCSDASSDCEETLSDDDLVNDMVDVNPAEKRNATSPVDQEIPSKRSGIPRISSVSTTSK